MLTISSGHSASYLTDAVAAGRENYYTGAVTAGEPAHNIVNMSINVY